MIEVNSKKRNLMFAVMMVGAFISSLSQSLLTSALPSIMIAFHISASLGQWLTTIYILVLGVVTGCTAWLINRMDTRRLFFMATFIFFLGCLMALFAGNFELLLISRVVQALGAGIHMPLLQVSALRMYPTEKHGKMLGLTGLVIGFAPAIGPTISGIMVDSFGWQSLFFLMMMIAAVTMIVGIFVITDISQYIKGKFDFLSACLYGIGFCLFMFGVTRLDFMNFLSLGVLAPLLTGVLCLVIFVFNQLKVEHPFLEIRIFADRDFTVSTILVSLTYIAMMSGTLLIPLYVQTVRGFSATISGIVLLPGSLLLGILSPFSGSIYDRFGARILVICGMVMLTVGTAAISLFGSLDSLIWITGAYCLRMIGISMLLMPLMSFGVHNLSGTNISHGAAIFNSIRQMAGSLGSTIFVVIASKLSLSETIDVEGINAAFGIQTALMFLGVIVSLVFIKSKIHSKIVAQNL
jgi:EmrB/QacA subfamily drug resistance transporter